MSKAFLKDDMPPPDDADALPPRAQRLPITPAGYARLRRELDALAQRPAANEVGARRARVLAQVLASVDVVEPSLVDGRAGFGTRVTVEEPDGRRVSYDLVGPDEAELAAGQISIASPVAQALRGKRAGDTAVLRRPKGDVAVTIVDVGLAA
ncbi:MAG: GreA/GreB family elongation factor [Candidatus Rokubacteria bacterium]|nr:GreA/GreB family elongation factor [Candidatus Rokubacteria bacterium]